MTARTGSAVPLYTLAVCSLIGAIATGVGWLGKPFHLVQLLTIIGLTMSAGVAFARAIWRNQLEKPDNDGNI